MERVNIKSDDPAVDKKVKKGKPGWHEDDLGGSVWSAWWGLGGLVVLLRKRTFDTRPKPYILFQNP